MISGLEHYRESAEVLESWWKIKREYQKCMRNLNYHKLAFEGNLEELLLPLIADEEQLQRLLEDPGKRCAWYASRFISTTRYSLYCSLRENAVLKRFCIVRYFRACGPKSVIEYVLWSSRANFSKEDPNGRIPSWRSCSNSECQRHTHPTWTQWNQC